MLVKKQSQTLTFNNGAINVLEVEDRVIRSNRMENIHYHQDAKSFSRFWKAYAAGVEIQTVISIPFIHSIKQNDVVELTDFSSGEKRRKFPRKETRQWSVWFCNPPPPQA